MHESRPSPADAASFDEPRLLRGYPLIHTTSIEEAEAIESRLNAPVRAIPRTSRQPFEWRANHLAVGNIGILAAAYRGRIGAVSADIGDLYSLMVPFRGTSTITANGTTTMLAPGRALMLSPRAALRVELEDYGGIQVGIAASVIDAAFGVLTGAAPRRPIAFAQDIDLAAEPSYLRLIRFIIDEADRDPRILRAPTVATGLTDAFIHALLLDGVHDHRAQLDRPARAAEPTHVRRVEELIRARLTEPLTFEELVKVAGVSARSLQLAFRAHRSSSPMSFLRDRRLDLARTKLLASDGREAIADIALASGFTHAGRFSLAYRARFGESPRDTFTRGFAPDPITKLRP